MLIRALAANWTRFLVLFGVIAALSPRPLAQPFVSSLQRAAMFQKEGNYAGVYEALASALEFEPGIPEVQYEAARAAFAAGLPAEAGALLANLGRQPGADSSLACLGAEVWLAAGDLDQSYLTWESATQTQCYGQEDYLRRLGAAYLAQGSAEAAIPVWQAWAVLEPDNPQPRLLMGLHRSVRAPASSLPDLQAADRLTPGGNALAQSLIELIENAEEAQAPAATLAQVGQVLSRGGEWELAVIAFESAVALQPDYADALAFLGLAREQVGVEGLDDLLAAAESAPNSHFPHLLLGMHWREEGDLERALDSLQVAARLDPSNSVIAAELGAVYAQDGDLLAAESSFRKATSLAPDDPAFWLLLADFSIANTYKLEDLAIPAARNAVALGPEDASNHIALGVAHLLAEDSTLAERHLLEALKLDSDRVETYYYLGLVGLARADSAFASLWLEQASDMDPEGAVGDMARRALASLSR